jgi:hypothetical protein
LICCVREFRVVSYGVCMCVYVCIYACMCSITCSIR